MIDYRNPPHALLIITSPYYNEKLNEFLLTCDWESLNKKWNRLGDDDRYWGRHQKTVEFIFFEEQPNWREKYQPSIDSGEITAELLEENRPFNVLRDYVHKTLKLDEVDKPMLILLFLEPNPNHIGYYKRLIYKKSLEMLSNDDFYEQVDSFLEKGFAKKEQHLHSERRYTGAFGVGAIIGGSSQNNFFLYSGMSINDWRMYIKKLENDLEATIDEGQKTIIQANIDILKEKFLSGKLSVGVPLIEISNRDRIMIVGHIDASFHINRAKDKALYFYFLMRAKLEQKFISFEDMMEQDIRKLSGIYEGIRDGKKKETVFNIRDLQDFRETRSRINRRIEEKVAEHLTDGYAITAQDQKLKLYGIQAEPDRIKIHEYSSLGWYMKSRVNVI